MVVAGETLSIYQSAAIAPASVCARTPPVRDAIVSATGRDCGAISEFDLLEVTSLNLQYELRREGITTLDAGDFTGLGSLTTLRLAGNGLATIPDGAFDDLVGPEGAGTLGQRTDLRAGRASGLVVAANAPPRVQSPGDGAS